MAARRIGLAASLAARRLAGPRMRPSLFIIGAQKAGTTSLHGHLARHPQVLPPLVKEVHYFDVAAQRSTAWYGAHFPTAAEADAAADATGLPVLTFDTTPYYIFHPHVADRVADFADDAKIIAVLRDPVARAWSHYWHEWGRGFERLEPLAALEAEQGRLPDPHHRIGDSPRDRFMHQHYSYCARSEYAPQIARWQARFGADRVLCIKSERLFAEPGAVLGEVADFLGIAPFAATKPRALNTGDYDPPPPAAEAWLKQRLAAPAEAVRALLGDGFQWP